MDPAFFRIDWEVLAETLFAIIVLAFFVERALSLVFEHRYFVTKFDKSGIKEPIALLFSYGTVYLCKLDAIAVIFKLDHPTFFGYLITAAVVAGGSKASIKLFQDIFDAKSSAVRELKKQPKRT